MQLIHEHLGKSYVVGSREYQEMMFGVPQALKIITDESGEVVTFYRHKEDSEKNEQLDKSLRDRYPGQPLLKAIGLFENEMLLKSKPLVVLETKESIRKAFQPVFDNSKKLRKSIQNQPRTTKTERLMKSLFDY